MALAPDDQRWVETARIVANLGIQVQALAASGGREAERLRCLEPVTCAVQGAATVGQAAEHRTTTRAPFH